MILCLQSENLIKLNIIFFSLDLSLTKYTSFTVHVWMFEPHNSTYSMAGNLYLCETISMTVHCLHNVLYVVFYVTGVALPEKLEEVLNARYETKNGTGERKRK